MKKYYIYIIHTRVFYVLLELSSIQWALIVKNIFESETRRRGVLHAPPRVLSIIYRTERSICVLFVTLSYYLHEKEQRATHAPFYTHKYLRVHPRFHRHHRHYQRNYNQSSPSSFIMRIYCVFSLYFAMRLDLKSSDQTLYRRIHLDSTDPQGTSNWDVPLTSSGCPMEVCGV